MALHRKQRLLDKSRSPEIAQVFFWLDAHAVGLTTMDENPAGTVGDRPEHG